MERRQFGIVDLQGRTVGINGTENNPASLYVSGKVGENIFFQVQGNILFSDDVAYDAALAFTKATGTLADRVMSSMRVPMQPVGTSGARARSLPRPRPRARERRRTSRISRSRRRTMSRAAPTNDGNYYAYISVTDENIHRRNADAVRRGGAVRRVEGSGSRAPGFLLP